MVNDADTMVSDFKRQGKMRHHRQSFSNLCKVKNYLAFALGRVVLYIVVNEFFAFVESIETSDIIGFPSLYCQSYAFIVSVEALQSNHNHLA